MYSDLNMSNTIRQLIIGRLILGWGLSVKFVGGFWGHPSNKGIGVNMGKNNMCLCVKCKQ